MHPYNILDLAFLIVILVSVLLGFMKGLVRQLLALFFLALGLVLAFIFYPDLAAVFLRRLRDPLASDFAAFLLILLSTILAGTLLTLLAKKVIVIGPLKIIDRLTGAGFGLIRGIILSFVLIAMMHSFQIKLEILHQSRLKPVISDLMRQAVRLLPEDVRTRVEPWMEYAEEKDGSAGRSI